MTSPFWASVTPSLLLIMKNVTCSVLLVPDGSSYQSGQEMVKDESLLYRWWCWGVESARVLHSLTLRNNFGGIWSIDILHWIYSHKFNSSLSLFQHWWNRSSVTKTIPMVRDSVLKVMLRDSLQLCYIKQYYFLCLDE